MDRRFWSTVLLLLVVVGCATTNDADQDDNKPEGDLKGRQKSFYPAWFRFRNLKNKIRFK